MPGSCLTVVSGCSSINLLIVLRVLRHKVNISFFFNLKKIKLIHLDLYLKEFTFKVVATDGYASTEDTFTLKCSKIPFSLVISYIGIIGGPLVSALGMYSYRIQIYNILRRKKYTHPPKTVKVG
jgi:hypothetical protein